MGLWDQVITVSLATRMTCQPRGGYGWLVGGGHNVSVRAGTGQTAPEWSGAA
jgi:hypothetical protein